MTNRVLQEWHIPVLGEVLSDAVCLALPWISGSEGREPPSCSDTVFLNQLRLILWPTMICPGERSMRTGKECIFCFWIKCSVYMYYAFSTCSLIICLRPTFIDFMSQWSIHWCKWGIQVFYYGCIAISPFRCIHIYIFRCCYVGSTFAHVPSCGTDLFIPI